MKTDTGVSREAIWETCKGCSRQFKGPQARPCMGAGEAGRRSVWLEQREHGERERGDEAQEEKNKITRVFQGLTPR